MTAPTQPDSQLSDPDGHTHNGRYHVHTWGSTPHDHTTPAPFPIAPRKWRITTGAIVIIGAALIQWQPWITYGGQTYSVADARNVCASGIGQIAQALNAGVAHDCNAATVAYSVLWLALLAGVGLVAWGLLTKPASAPSSRG